MLDTTDQARLFTHSRRPQWGVGLPTDEAENKRSLRFKDGSPQLRADFYHLLEEFEGSDAVIATVASEPRPCTTRSPRWSAASSRQPSSRR